MTVDFYPFEDGEPTEEALRAMSPRFNIGYADNLPVDWAAQVMSDMDGLYHGPAASAVRAALPETPSTYFRRNCFVGASFLSNWEAKFCIEHEYAANVMWGDDYPHAEGTWPHTREWLRMRFHDVPVDETRMILGLNAVDCYGFDVGALAPLVERIGPTVDDIHGGELESSVETV